MIVPRIRLLWWTLLVVVPTGTVAGTVPGALTLCLSLIGVLALVVLVDATFGADVLAGLGLELPGTVRLMVGREGTIPVRIHNSRGQACRLRVGLALSPGIASAPNGMLVSVPEGENQSVLSWPCTASRRGLWHLAQAAIERDSCLGFWSVRRRIPTKTKIRVYPSLIGERKHLSALFLNHGGTGVHAQRQLGQGREFEKLREYTSGDSYDGIHWKATARHGRPISKEFQVERTQEVYVIVDTSRLSGRSATADATGKDPTTRTTSLDRFVDAALVLGLAAERQGDLFGVVVFSDRIRSFVRARNGATHYRACRDVLHLLATGSENPDFDELFTFIRLRLRRRALLVLLTDLDDPVLAESLVRNMGPLSRHHVVLVGMPTPAGAHPLFSSPDVFHPADLHARLGGHLRWHSLRELGHVLQRHGVHFILMDNEMMCPQLVAQYVKVKQRQLL
jgi:uncharacterized protein (DUF58 family)